MVFAMDVMDATKRNLTSKLGAIKVTDGISFTKNQLLIACGWWRGCIRLF